MYSGLPNRKKKKKKKKKSLHPHNSRHRGALGFAGVSWCSRATRRKCPTNGSVCRVPHAMSQSPLIGISEDSEEFRGSSPKASAEALVAQLRKEAEAHGVDVVTWLMRDKSTDE